MAHCNGTAVFERSVVGTEAESIIGRLPSPPSWLNESLDETLFSTVCIAKFVECNFDIARNAGGRYRIGYYGWYQVTFDVSYRVQRAQDTS